MFTIVPFEECWQDDSFEVIAGKYRVNQEIQQRALLAVTSLQPDVLADTAKFLLKRHTPGGAPVQNSNIAQAIRSAVTAAFAAGGGHVIIPPGIWSMGHEECHFLTSHLRDNVMIRGSGMDCTVLNYATGFTGTAFKFTGEDSPGYFYANGGMADMSINCQTLDEANTGCAIHIESCINTQFRNITIRNFAGGAGFRSRQVGIDGTNQYIQLWNFTSASNRINYDLQAFVNCQGYGVYANSGQYRDFLLEDVKASFYGGNVQTSAPVAIELVGVGRCRLLISDFYYEGFCPTILKLNSPTGSFNQVNIHRFHLGGSPALFADTDLFNNLTIMDLYGAGNATKVLKSRNGAPVLLVNVTDPISSPDKFDLDAASAAALTCVQMGGVQYSGNQMHSAKGFSLPSFATGSEPGSMANGTVVRDSTYDRPSVKMASAWKRVAFSDDLNSELNAMLAPYSADIFDPRIKRMRSVISGALDSLTGLVHSTPLAALTSGQRPTWNASDDAFGGHPSFTCSLTGNKFLQGTLAVPVAVGSRPGLFVVFRVNTAGTDAARRAIAVCENPSQPVNLFMGYSDLNQATTPYCYYTPSIGGGAVVTAPARSDADPHLMVVNAEPGPYLYLDGQLAITGGDLGVTTHALSLVTLGGVFDSSIYAGCEVTIAYAAVLKQGIPADLQARIQRAAIAKYAVL